MMVANNEKMDKNEFNISFSILRMILSFIVVNNHLLDKSKVKYIYLSKLLKSRISVPIFFIMSFFLCHKFFLTNDKIKIMRRLERLIIPYIAWPIIIWIFKKLFHLRRKNSFYDLKIQILTGHNFIPVLWFQLNLIVSTILILLIQKIFNKNTLFILVNLYIISFYLQYSHINKKYFSKFSYCTKYPLGRFIEIIPFCISGYIIGSLYIMKYLKKYRIKTLHTLILIIFSFIKYNIFIAIEGFQYQGIKLFIISIIIFIIFALNPFEKITNYKNIILILTNYTSGIYYLHLPIWNYLSYYMILLRKKTYSTSIIIYIICYFISFIGIRIFGKTKLKHLFL